MTLLSERHVPRSLVEPLSLTGRVCLVTGGASGLGAATSRELGLAGANVVIADLDARAAGSTAGEIVGAGGSALAARLDVRDPTSRWGSASREGRLMFSWRLVLAPPAALETVVVHELAHLKVFGHGPRFLALVASRSPDHLAARAWLRRHAHELHTALETAEPEARLSA